MIERIIVKREKDGRWVWSALDRTGREIGKGHKSFTRLANALRNIERLTGCSTEIMRKASKRHRVAAWGREFVIEVED